MVMPAMRMLATVFRKLQQKIPDLSLPLLVARVAAHDVHPPFAADHLARRTADVYGRFDLHSLEPSCDAGLAAVGVQFQKDLVPHENFNAVEPHFAREIR